MYYQQSMKSYSAFPAYDVYAFIVNPRVGSCLNFNSSVIYTESHRQR